jgi:amidase
MADWHFMSAVELAAAIAAREISSEALLEHFLDRTDRLNPAINAIVVDDRDRARKAARAADAALTRGGTTGPLHGVPMTVKESYDVAGLPTTRGLERLRDNVASEDALSVQRLRAAGAVIFGKTNVPVSLADFQSYNPIYGTTNNPWDTGRTPGGSSGGSAAALAAGLTGFETGSDIGGSIRNPAHYCGVFGHKPTFDLLPMLGHGLPNQLSGPDLSVIGPLGRSAADLRLGVDVMAGPDALSARGLRFDLPELDPDPAQLRVAVWADDDTAPVDASVRDAVLRVASALAKTGASVDRDARPDFQPGRAHEIYQFLLQAEMAARVPDEEAAALARDAAALAPDDDSPRARVLRAQTASLRTWKAQHEARTRLRWSWHHFFERFDVLVAPIMATSAFPHDQSAQLGRRTVAVNGEPRPYFEQLFWPGLAIASYLPATVIPTGLDAGGLPVGVQLIGPAYGDLITIGVAARLEAAGFGFRAPPGF